MSQNEGDDRKIFHRYKKDADVFQALIYWYKSPTFVLFCFLWRACNDYSG